MRSGQLRWRHLPFAALSTTFVFIAASCGGGSTANSDTASPEVLTAEAAGPMAVQAAGSVVGAPFGYLEYLPPGYGDGEGRPLLVFLHGSFESGDGSREALDKVFRLGLPALIESGGWPDDRPFVVLAPQYGVAEAQECHLAEEVDAFLDFAIDHYDIDPSRVYLTGISCGGIGVWDYLAVHRETGVAAAAVPISAHAVDAFAAAGCELARVPVWAFHGAADTTVPERYIVNPLTKLKACTDPDPVELRLTVYPDADHDAWSQTYDLSAGEGRLRLAPLARAPLLVPTALDNGQRSPRKLLAAVSGAPASRTHSRAACQLWRDRPERRS